MMNRDTIVLAYPHSSAFYWLLSAELNNVKLKEDFTKAHPYYNMYGNYFRTLFGKNPSKLIDEVVSLSLLYDNIYLSPWDIDMPKAHRWNLRFALKYEDKDFGVKFDWMWRANSEEYFSEIPKLLENEKIKKILAKLDIDGQEQFLQDCITQIFIANQFKASIIGGKDTIVLLKLINDTLKIQQIKLHTELPKLEAWGLNSTFQLSSLCLEIKKLDEYRILRSNKTILKYAQIFKKYLITLPYGNTDDSILYNAMLEAIETEELASKICGGLDVTGTILNIAGLIPVVGTVTGIVGLAADAGEKGTDKIKENNSWWALAPEISKQLTKYRIEEKVRKGK